MERFHSVEVEVDGCGNTIVEVEGGSLMHAVMAAQSTNMSPAIIRTLRLFCPSVIHQVLNMRAASVC